MPAFSLLPQRKGLFRTRAVRLRASHDFGLVLVLVIASFLFAGIAPDGTWASCILVLLEAVTLVVALWTAGLTAADSKTNLALVTAAGASALALVISGGTSAAGAVAVLSAVLAVSTAATIGIGVLDQGEVNRQSVRGAFAVYILLGMVFVFVYGAVAVLGSGPFFAQGTDGTRPLRVYFSFVTLATLGYGDYTPAGNLGHMLAVVETLFGQLYLVTVVASIVARLGIRSER
jgi:hypothetical protein